MATTRITKTQLGQLIREGVKKAIIANEQRAPRARQPVDPTAVSELVLYIENDGELYRQMVQPIIKNLQKKKANGVYNPTKAVKLWKYLADAGAKKYMKEFGSQGDGVSMVFSPATREAVAAELADSFAEELGMAPTA